MLCMPDYAGHFWPFGFVALIPILLRVNNRGFWARVLIPFFAYYIFLVNSLVWVSQYGWHWLFVECFMNSVTFTLAFPLFFFIRRKLKSELCYIILPALVLLSEYGRSLGFLSFPWPYLHHGQYANLPFIQISEFTGAWGVSFLLVWFNAAIFGIIAARFRVKALLSAVPALAAVAFAFIFGFSMLSAAEPDASTEVSLFQRDVNTQTSWTIDINKEAWLDYSGMTIEEWSQNLNYDNGGFIVWPEGAIPDALDEFPIGPYGMSRRQMIGGLAKRTGKTFILGTQDDTEDGPYNAAAVFSPEGGLIGIYRKIHIVPFGEVIPLENHIKSWFPEYPWGDESLIDGRELEGIDTVEGRVGIVICYESFFPDLTRRIVADDCDFLFLLTNTSWFGKSKASSEHAHFDVFRAIENRIWLSRAATTGVSSFIDPEGRRYDETGLYVKQAITRRIAPRRWVTFYTKHGDWLPRLCLLGVLIMLTIAIYRSNSTVPGIAPRKAG